MSNFRVSPEAEAQLEDIWLHIARESGSMEIATRVVESISDRFWLLRCIRG
jgi:plasmid stabilization system protein ParE